MHLGNGVTFPVESMSLHGYAYGSLVPRLFFFLLCLLEHEKQVAETRREREYLHLPTYTHA